jgi:digeranylgeranylglycerophospholipid reductase
MARSAGVGFRARRFNRAVALMVELDSPDDPIPSAELVLRPASVPWGYLWIFPHGDHLNVGVASLCGAHAGSLRAMLDRFIEQDPRLRHRRRLRSLAGAIPLRPARRLCRDGVLVAGDAAGLVNPFTGAGIHHAMRSGQVAGRACVAALARGSSRCFYGLRLGLGATYLWLLALSAAAGAALLLSRLWRRPLYAPVLRAMMADHDLIYRIASRVH